MALVFIINLRLTSSVFASTTVGTNITTSGQVGIGNTSPTSMLDVSGAMIGKALASFNETGDQNILTASASGITKFVIDHSGKVGIGTTSPTQKLDVAGNIALPITIDSTSGVIYKGGVPFLHNYAAAGLTGDSASNIFLGLGAGNFTFAPPAVPGFGEQAANNIGIGYLALTSLTTAEQNIGIGSHVMELTDTGSYNIGLGVDVLKVNTSGTHNVGIGTYVLIKNTTGNYNVAVGVNDLEENISGTNNTALGWAALRNNTTANNNTAVGMYALNLNTTGVLNTAVGATSLEKNLTGNENTGIGMYALRNTTAGYNTALGSYSGYLNAGGTNNVALGTNALYSNVSGNYNVAVGKSALYGNTSSNSVGVGYGAGQNNTWGNNIYLGYAAGYRQITAQNQLLIGNQLYADAATELSNSIIYGVMAATPANQTLTFNAKVGIGTTSSGEKLEVNGGMRLNTATAKPTCDSTKRGEFWVTQGAAGVKDNVEVCAKDAADAYAWRTLY